MIIFFFFFYSSDSMTTIYTHKSRGKYKALFYFNIFITYKLAVKGCEQLYKHLYFNKTARRIPAGLAHIQFLIKP